LLEAVKDLVEDSGKNIFLDFGLSRHFFVFALDNFTNPLRWLQKSLVEEADDRSQADSDSEDEDVGVAILPLEDDCLQAMEKEKFLQVLKLLEIVPPGKNRLYINQSI